VRRHRYRTIAFRRPAALECRKAFGKVPLSGRISGGGGVINLDDCRSARSCSVSSFRR
jgi:hypothetical protein